MCTDFGYAPKTLHCASETCIHWTNDHVQSIFPETDMVANDAEMVVMSIFPDQDKDCMKTMGGYSKEYQLLHISNIYSLNEVNSQIDLLLVKKGSEIFEVMTSGWLQ